MKAEEFLQQYKNQLLMDLASLIAIESVEGEPAPDAPFGKGPRKALDTALAIAQRLGLSTCDGDGYLGWAEAKGTQTKPYLASISHLDVVPAGNGWTGDPFSMRSKEGVLIGRGISDDKGPSVLMLYAAKYLQQEHLLRYPFRVLLGCNEETNMQDVPYYLAHNEMPAFTFSPDGDFPVCNGEKGILTADLTAKRPQDSCIVDFNGGSASNMVPDCASAVVVAQNLPAREHITLTSLENGMTKIEAKGIGGHAAMPEDTRNAIGMLAEYLQQQNLLAEEEKGYFALLQKLFADTDGKALGIAFERAPFTPLTCVGSVMRLENGTYRQTINIRYPEGTTGEALCTVLQETAGDAAALQEAKNDPPFYIDADNPAIEALLKAYSKRTGTEAKPFTMGGGTYARHFDNAVSFGMEQPKELLPDWAGPIHGADEALGEQWLLDAFYIYVDAIEALQHIDFS